MTSGLQDFADAYILDELDETKEYSSSLSYVFTLDGILFNQPVDYTGFITVPTDYPENASFHWYLSFRSDDAVMLFGLSETLFNAYVKLCGDPTRVAVSFEDSTEHDLREAFRAGEPVFYDVSFTQDAVTHSLFFSKLGSLSLM